MLVDWDDAFENGAYIADADRCEKSWIADAAAFRDTARCVAGLSYGTGARCGMDLFLPDAAPRGLFVFVHGGYWMKSDRSDWSHMAAGAVGLGWAALVPDYPLAPEAAIDQITVAVAASITAGAARVDGPIRLAGHSAGGHLVTRMVCRDTPLSGAVQQRVERATSISGLHDLRPLTATRKNGTLRLTEAIARAESPALHAPARPLSLWVGAQERPEFLRQTRLMAESWERQGGDVSSRYDAGRHHFDVIDGLTRPGSDLMQEIMR